MKIIASTTKLNPLHPDFDPQLSALATSIVSGLGVLPNSDGEYTSYEVPNQFLTLDTADLLHSKGVEITEFPLFIEITDPTEVCPFLDGGSWEEWKLPNHTLYEADGRVFIGTNAHTNEDMDWADLQIIRPMLATADMLSINQGE